MAAKVEKRIALMCPFFILDKFTLATPTLADNSFRLIFLTTSPQNGDSHFSSTENRFLSIQRDTAAEAANSVMHAKTVIKFLALYSAGDASASMIFLPPSERILAEP